MSKVNVISFRASVPTGTTAAAPVVVALESMSSALQRFTIFTMGAVDFSKCGFRLKNQSQLIIPDQGSQDQITLSAANEAQWSPMVNAPLDLIFAGRPLQGAPFSLSLELYNTTGADILVGGFIHTNMPELTIHDLVMELKKAREAAIPVQFDPRVKVNTLSDDAPYPVQQVKK